MTKVILADAPSTLYRIQIRNITARMSGLISQTLLNPLRSMAAFDKTKEQFSEARGEALLCCGVMDTASIENEDRADHATTAIIREMVHLKNGASDLIENEPNETLENRRNDGSSEMRDA